MIRWLATVLCATTIAHAQIDIPDPDAPAQGELVAEHESVAPGGSVWVGVRITMKPKWHVYWRNPGDSGMPVRIKWTLPEGVACSPLQWPAPHRIPTDPLMTYGYEDVVLLAAKLTVPKDWKGDSIEIGAQADWLVCTDVCLEGGMGADLKIPVKAGGDPKPTEWAPEFRKARAALPGAAPEGAIEATRKGLRIDLSKLPIAEKARVYFFPRKAGWLDHAAAQPLSRQDGHALLALRRTQPDSEIAGNRNVSGVLVIETGKERRAFAVDLTIPEEKPEANNKK